MTEWMPIESAPKDGRDILGYADGGMTVVRWCWYYWSLAESGMGAEDGEWWPKYWQPLPEPPTY